MRTGKMGIKAGAWGGMQGGFGRASFSEETTVKVAEASYSDASNAELLFMLEEEKLAGDLYDVFYDMYGLTIFDNIAVSEGKHFDALLAQATTLGLDTDAIVFAEAGDFVNPELQEMYDDLLATGSLSATAALEVGIAIETKDIVDITAAAEAVEGTALAAVYDNLLAGSENHLTAFEAWL